MRVYSNAGSGIREFRGAEDGGEKSTSAPRNPGTRRCFQVRSIDSGRRVVVAGDAFCGLVQVSRGDTSAFPFDRYVIRVPRAKRIIHFSPACEIPGYQRTAKIQKSPNVARNLMVTWDDLSVKYALLSEPAEGEAATIINDLSERLNDWSSTSRSNIERVSLMRHWTLHWKVIDRHVPLLNLRKYVEYAKCFSSHFCIRMSSLKNMFFILGPIKLTKYLKSLDIKAQPYITHIFYLLELLANWNSFVENIGYCPL